MDYENKHKEEIIRATQLWECGDITRENLEYIFPELRESEDEKIRKELISFVNNDGWKFTKLTKEEKESWIAWLEKQGEPKLAESTDEKVGKELIKHLKEGVEGYMPAGDSSDYHDGLIFLPNLSAKPMKKGFTEGRRIERKADKSKWTEEDDYNVHCCIAKVESDIADGYSGRNNEIINWLKSLKQRMEE